MQLMLDTIFNNQQVLLLMQEKKVANLSLWIHDYQIQQASLIYGLLLGQGRAAPSRRTIGPRWTALNEGEMNL